MTRITLIAAVGAQRRHRPRRRRCRGTCPRTSPTSRRRRMGHALVMGRTHVRLDRPAAARAPHHRRHPRPVLAPRRRRVRALLPGCRVAGRAGRRGLRRGRGPDLRRGPPLAHRLVITEVDAEPEGDTWFPAWPRTTGARRPARRTTAGRGWSTSASAASGSATAARRRRRSPAASGCPARPCRRARARPWRGASSWRRSRGRARCGRWSPGPGPAPSASAWA